MAVALLDGTVAVPVADVDDEDAEPVANVPTGLPTGRRDADAGDGAGGGGGAVRDVSKGELDGKAGMDA